MALGVFGQAVRKYEVPWEVSPYPESESRRLGRSYIGGDVRSPVSMILPRELITFRPRDLPKPHSFDPIDISSRLSYGHWGVGEKGPASRLMADRLGSYAESSVANVLKTALLAEKNLAKLAKNRYLKKVKQTLDLISSKFSVGKNEIRYWLTNDSLSNKLKRRGISPLEVRKEIDISNKHLSLPSTEERVFLGRFQIRNRRQIYSTLSSREVSNKLSFEGTGPKIPKIYGKLSEGVYEEGLAKDIKNTTYHKTAPIIDSKLVFTMGEVEGAVNYHSHVNLKVVDAPVNMSVLDKILVRSIRGEG